MPRHAKAHFFNSNAFNGVGHAPNKHQMAVSDVIDLPILEQLERQSKCAFFETDRRLHSYSLKEIQRLQIALERLKQDAISPCLSERSSDSALDDD